MSKMPGPYQPLGGQLEEIRGLDNPPPYSAIDPTRPDQVASAPMNYPHPPSIGFVDDSDSIFRSRGPGAPSIASSTDDNIEPATVVSRGVVLASKPINVTCPHCKAETRTSIEKKPGVLAYVSGAIIACFCCFCGCCLIPCCIDQCMKVDHTCSNCGRKIGSYRL